MNIQQIGIPVRDLQKAIEFYERIGFSVLERLLPRQARLQSVHTNVLIVLNKESSGTTGVWIYMEVSSLKDAVIRLENAGVEFREAPGKKSWTWDEAWFDDPDGNHIVLYSRPDHTVLPPWKIH